RHVLDCAPAELSQYDAEIERLCTHLETLVADRATVHMYSEGCRSILAQIRQLPPEVLVEVFSL
ncbi:hypothetical protein B0H10DRAFT_1755132, partial [Mycena sp. CBHHK59/15]